MKFYNYSAGPSALFPEVVEQIKHELGNWQNTHSSVFEISHRGPEFMKFAKEMENTFRELLQVPDDYAVLFLQGGGRGAFDAVPLNLPLKHKRALYLTSGHWSRQPALEAQKYLEVKTAELVDKNFQQTKIDWTEESKDCDYVHFTSNETVEGIENFNPPKVAPGVLVVADMSSDILSRPINVNDYDVIYAGAQKNIGCSGVTVYVVRKSLLGHASKICPAILNWETYHNSDSLFNTPATFSWYTCGLTFKYLKDTFKDLANLEQVNIKKASKLYAYLDSEDFYQNKVPQNLRSRMNISFNTPNEELDAKFVQEAKEAGLYYLKGHKVIGGLRASTYNAIPEEAVDQLISFMKVFADKYK
ncbi:3-phosphoserine/phosphohydroxythreonine transaminase [Psittacicella gerlachiana]|uniref:Phosphoserine aminotransferase n=1 Tax=Psittacicella gerlachiana TaxID=2028574 RepID=A0A3A1Y9H7_9GAMM|nr:3-phosphoserine/phosphohydroxythreonine transaminase [Psittacicella gerlachiana]RIY33976.1 phosphoserine transaminase [Psittacicella gerlachiana]